jgi:hypothetical protein
MSATAGDAPQAESTSMPERELMIGCSSCCGRLRQETALRATSEQLLSRHRRQSAEVPHFIGIKK